MSLPERDAQPQRGRRQRRQPGQRQPTVMMVGEHITCPGAIASGGTIPIRSERAAQVARWFGLDRNRKPRATGGGAGNGTADAKAASERPHAFSLPKLSLRAGTITLIAGPSGAGKSTLLRATRDAHPNRRWIDLATVAAADDDGGANAHHLPLVDCFGHLPLRDTLALLARVGLGEAWSYLRTPAELSEGQRWRFRLALALHDAARHAADAPVIACDEFAAVLDRVTALIVAHRLRRAIDAIGHAAAVVATSHEDVESALAAEMTVRCDFGREEIRMTKPAPSGRRSRTIRIKSE